jgi:Fic family protein
MTNSMAANTTLLVVITAMLDGKRVIAPPKDIQEARNCRGNVGVMNGDTVVHMAPPANRIKTLTADLLEWLAITDQHPLITSSVFHYEFEFIHPFTDGNGRMGRLWQTLILSQWQPLLSQLLLLSSCCQSY